MASITKAFTILMLLAFMGGCATTQDPSKWPAQKFYDEARKSMKSEDYESAIKHYEDLEIHHPFSPYTQQAQLEVIYAYYKYDEAESAIAAADRYIKLYPRAKDVDYAYYMRGLINFERGMSNLDLWLGLEPSTRQQDTALSAYRYFQELIKRFPDSKYVGDAEQRMVALRNQLARYELNVADYYFRRGAYLSAANRAIYALENYPQTPAIPDALVIMIKSYRKLGVDDLAADALKVMKLNYPDNKALKQLN